MQGPVVAIVGFRTFLDVGCGFPAWISIGELEAHEKRGRAAVPHAIGDVVEGVVLEPDGREQHTLRLSREEPDWIRFNGALVGHAFGRSLDAWTKPGARVSFQSYSNDAHAAFIARSRESSAPLEVVRGLEVTRVEVRLRDGRLEVVSAQPAA